MRAKQRVVAEVERVVHVHRRVIGGKVQRSEVVPLRFGFGTHGDREAELAKDVAYLVDHDGDWMHRATPGPARGHREIDVRFLGGGAAKVRLTSLEGSLQRFL